MIYLVDSDLSGGSGEKLEISTKKLDLNIIMISAHVFHINPCRTHLISERHLMNWLTTHRQQKIGSKSKMNLVKEGLVIAWLYFILT